MLTFQKLIRLETKLLDESKVKLVRHKDNRVEYRDIIKDKNSILEYQKIQSKEVFKDTDFIVSFIGQESTKSLFFGIFKVGGVSFQNGNYYYDLIRTNLFEEFIDRVVIDWGKSAIKWEQWYDKNLKEVLEILPKGFIGNFPGLTNFVLTFDELTKLIENPDANREWKNHLSSINGIYMILDKSNGNQYIGSAYGKEGIWQRWSEYAKTKHGGNKSLIELIEKDNNYQKNFQYTVLQNLPSNLNSKEVIRIENLYKIKFGSKTYGLNEN